MIKVNIPGYKDIEIKNVVFDYNGTIAEDGTIPNEVREKIKELSKKGVNIFVVTADTYGTVAKECIGLPLKVEIFDKENASEDKKNIVKNLGVENTVTIGNGRNDVEMFKNSVVSIAVIGREGCFSKALFEADIVVNDIVDAMDLLIKKDRMKATLRT